MAKHILNSKDELDFVLLGLQSQENQYSLISSVNKTLGTEFILSDHIPYNLKDGKLFYFSLYRFASEEFGIEYFFIPNNSNLDTAQINEVGGEGLFADLNMDENIKLIKELPKTDYFIILKGEDLHLFQFKIIERLKTIKEIIQIQSIEPNDLPSKLNLVF